MLELGIWSFRSTNDQSPITISLRYLRLRVHQFIVKYAQTFRERACAGNDRHEIRVTAPAWHDVNVQMIGNTCARALANVQTDVEPLRLGRRAQKRLRMHHHIP